jgi:hypothetical protein
MSKGSTSSGVGTVTGGSTAPATAPRRDWVGRLRGAPTGSWVGIAEGELAERARLLEYEVFVEQGYCEADPDGRIAEYRPWEDRSQFHTVVGPDGRLIAAVRTTMGSYAGLPVGKFERWDEYPPDPVIEYASLVVPKGARGLGGAEELYRSVVHQALRTEAGGLVAIGEQWLFDLLNDVYDFGFRQLGPSRWYMGGECFPMGTSMEHLMQHFREDQPTLHDWFLEGLDVIDLRDPRPVRVRPVSVSPPKETTKLPSLVAGS